MGIVYSFQDHSSLALLAGLPSGACFGVTMYFVAGRDRNYPRLSREDRRTVGRAVRTGRHVADPALSDAVVARADQVVRPQLLENRTRICFSSLVAIGIVAIVFTFVRGDAGGAVLWSLWACFWVVMGICSPRLRRDQVEKAVRARNLALSNRPAAASGP